MDKKESSFMCLVGFECSLKDEKKQLHEYKILDSVLRSIYLKPCICLKSENVNIENEGVLGRNFLNLGNLAFQNDRMDRE